MTDSLESIVMGAVMAPSSPAPEMSAAQTSPASGSTAASSDTPLVAAAEGPAEGPKTASNGGRKLLLL